MKIVFFGSDDFAAAHLDYLIRNNEEVIACVTQPDRKKDRGMKVILSPLKKMAIEHGIEVIQPDDIKDRAFKDKLISLDADLFVVIAYGRILPQDILDIPNKYSINVHGSLLPQYRGAAPINWVIINGETETGVTIIKLNSKMDAGEIIASEVIQIDSMDDSQALRERMMGVGCQLLVKTMADIRQSKEQCVPQDSSKVSMAPKLTKQLGAVNWSTQTSMEIYNLVRGLVPWPRASTQFNNIQFKILEVRKLDLPIKGGQAGQIMGINKQGIVVKTKDGVILIARVHPESKNKMSADEFVRGYHLKEGDQLG